MTSAANIFGSHSPQQASTTPGLHPAAQAGTPGPTAWIEQFADFAVGHMAANGVMSLKVALEHLIEDEQKPEQDNRG